MKIVLKKEFLLLIEQDPRLAAHIAIITGQSLQQVMRWVKDNDEELTVKNVQITIRKHLGLANETVLTEWVREEMVKERKRRTKKVRNAHPTHSNF